MASEYYFILILIFLGLFGLIESVFLYFTRQKVSDIKKRLDALAETTKIEREKIRKKSLLDQELIRTWLGKIRLIGRLEELIKQSGINVTVPEFLSINFLLFIVVELLIFWVLDEGLLLGLAALILIPLGSVFFLNYKKVKRLEKIENQLPDVLDSLSRAMRAGHAFSSSLRTVSLEGEEPIASEFRRVSDEVNFGLTMRDAIVNLAGRVDSMDIRYFALAVLIQSETGGSLSLLLSDLATLIRERIKLRQRVKVLAAEGRLSAWILGSLPVAFGLLIFIVDRNYISYFWREADGHQVLMFMSFLMFIGVLWIRKITTIKV